MVQLSYMKQAQFYEKLSNNAVACRLCNHFCQITSNNLGICQARKNIAGELFSLNYGKIIAEHIDPIEKKPLYHFLPRTQTYSIACAGCNFRCLNCQNADISQLTPKMINTIDELPEADPEEIIERALAALCPSIAYTYTEPTIFVEFALECMKLAHRRGLANVWVSNGYMSPDCLEKIIPHLDAINIDLKSFCEETYQKICGARLQPILDNLQAIKGKNVHLEVTTLIIPAINDSEKELSDVAKFINDKLGDDTPWHVSAFHPTYKLASLPATTAETVLRAVKIGENAGLKRVYGGNI